MKKLKHENPWQVRTNFLNIELWLNEQTKKKDSTCTECKVKYKDLKDKGVKKIALMTIKGQLNKHLCNDCGERYINELGAIDIESQIIEKQKNRDIILEKIKDTDTDIKESWKNKESHELELILESILKEKKDKERLESISFSDSDLFVDDYLIKEYGVISDPKWLKDESQIKEYFEDDYSDYFDCGQGYYQDEADVIIKIGPKFFNVHLEAELGSQKQDRGDRLYWAECLENVTWKEIPKPIKKKTKTVSYVFELNDDEESRLNIFLSDNGIINIKK